MKFGWRSALGIALSAFLLWFTLRGANLHEVWQILSSSHIGWWMACTAAATAIFPLRARRWQAILAPMAGRLPVRSLWHATAIGMMVNNVFPLRAGEFARAFALSREQPKVPFAAAFASLAVDRVCDALVVLVLMLAATLDPRFPAGTVLWETDAGTQMTVGQIANTAMVFLGAVLVVLYALALAPDRFIGFAEGITRRVVPSFAPKVRALLENFVQGLGVLRSPKLALEVLAWAVVHWLMNALAFYFGFLALDLDAPPSAALFAQGLIAIGVAAPAAPGFFGVFEFFGKVGLGLYGVAAESAVSWAIGFHVLSFIPITVIGAWYFARLDMHFKDLKS